MPLRKDIMMIWLAQRRDSKNGIFSYDKSDAHDPHGRY